MTLRYIILFCICLSNFSGYTQHNSVYQGVRSFSLSNASINLTDHWAVFNNPSQIAFINKFSGGVFLQNYYGIKELNSASFTLVQPVSKKSTLGLGFHHFNQSVIFQQQKIGIAYGLKFFNDFSAGLKLNLLRTFTNEYGSNYTLFANLGLTYRINSRFSSAFFVSNPTFSKLSRYKDDELPVILSTGIKYHITKSDFFVLQLDNNTVTGFSVKGGVEVLWYKTLSLNLGMSSNPFNSSFGIGWQTKNLKIGLGFSFHPKLDLSSGAGIDYLR